MFFEVDPAAYGAFMGRFSEPLAVLFADLVGVRAGQRALDVGCVRGRPCAAERVLARGALPRPGRRTSVTSGFQGPA